MLARPDDIVILMSEREAAQKRALDVLVGDGDRVSIFVRLENDEAALLEALRMGIEGFETLDEYDPWEYQRGDVILEAALHFGVPRAQSLFDSAHLSQPIDVAERVESHARVLTALDAIASQASFRECADVLALVPAHEPARHWLWAELVRARPGRDVVLVSDLPADDLALVASEMRRLHAPASLLRELTSQGLSLEEVADGILRVWPEYVVPETDRSASAMNSMARMLSDNGHPVAELLEYLSDERVDVVSLRVMRKWGLRGTIAALALVERRELRAVGISGMLAEAGYDDESIMEALRTNGVGETATILALRDAGWTLERLADSLVARDASLMEMRDLLLNVGAARAEVEHLLLRHASADRVRLVLG